MTENGERKSEGQGHPKSIPIERVVVPDLKPIYVTGATGELTPSYGMIQFQLDRPIFKLVEDDKSIIEKIRREVLVELHMSYEVWKAVGSFMVKKIEHIQEHTQSEGQTRLERSMNWIKELDASRRESRARRKVEIESPELIGNGYPPPLDLDNVPQEVRQSYFSLERSINRIWTQARMNYVYEFFQSCVFLIGAILELLIEQFLRLRKVWSAYESQYPNVKSRTLGTLIGFCKDKGLLNETILRDASDINDLRIEAVHMKTEKGKATIPPDEHPLTDWEEISIMKSKGDQVSIEAEALFGEGMILDLSDPRRPAWKRELMYKPQAVKAFNLLSKVFWALRQAESPSK